MQWGYWGEGHDAAEIVREGDYQSPAVLLLPSVFNAGNVVRLVVDAWLAMPVASLPFFFGPQGVLNFGKDWKETAWMMEYPFALPTICNAVALMGSCAL
jgi:hypothetical protein